MPKANVPTAMSARRRRAFGNAMKCAGVSEVDIGGVGQRGRRARGAARLLLPQRQCVEYQGGHRRPLAHLDQPPGAEVSPQGAEQHRADEAAGQNPARRYH